MEWNNKGMDCLVHVIRIHKCKQIQRKNKNKINMFKFTFKTHYNS